jgi:hypothetical protein
MMSDEGEGMIYFENYSVRINSLTGACSTAVDDELAEL